MAISSQNLCSSASIWFSDARVRWSRRLTLHGWQGAAVLGPDGIAGRNGDLVNPFAVLLAPAEFYRAVHGWQAALTPVQARVGEPEVDQVVDDIHLLQAEHVTIEDVDTDVRGKAVVATGVGPSFSQRVPVRSAMYLKRRGLKHITVVFDGRAPLRLINQNNN